MSPAWLIPPSLPLSISTCPALMKATLRKCLLPSHPEMSDIQWVLLLLLLLLLLGPYHSELSCLCAGFLRHIPNPLLVSFLIWSSHVFFYFFYKVSQVQSGSIMFRGRMTSNLILVVYLGVSSSQHCVSCPPKRWTAGNRDGALLLWLHT